MWSLVILVSAGTLLVLLAFVGDRQDRALPTWVGVSWPEASYPEPANLAEVDAKIAVYRARASAPVIYGPSPWTQQVDRYSPLAYLEPLTPLAELLDSARSDVVMITAAPASTGRHRAPELVAA